MARPKGVKETRPRNTAARLLASMVAEDTRKRMAEGATPLDILLEAMRFYAGSGEREKAVAVAVQAAPYVHAKLAQVDAAIRSDTTLTHRFVLMGEPEAKTALIWEQSARALGAPPEEPVGDA